MRLPIPGSRNMSRMYTDTWESLQNWAKGLHSAVSTRVEERLTLIGKHTPAFVALYWEPDSQDEAQEYGCLIAADGWLYELAANIADGAVSLDTYPLAIVHLHTRTVGGRGQSSGETVHAASLRLRDDKEFEWVDTARPATRRQDELAKSAIRFVEALPRLLAPEGPDKRR